MCTSMLGRYARWARNWHVCKIAKTIIKIMKIVPKWWCEKLFFLSRQRRTTNTIIVDDFDQLFKKQNARCVFEIFQTKFLVEHFCVYTAAGIIFSGRSNMPFSNDFPFLHFLLIQTFRVNPDTYNNTFIFSSSNFVTFSHDLLLVDFLLVETCRITLNRLDLWWLSPHPRRHRGTGATCRARRQY